MAGKIDLEKINTSSSFLVYSINSPLDEKQPRGVF